MNTSGDVLSYVRLKFNIEKLNFDDCYAEGYEHALNEGDEFDNPFSENSAEAEHWSLGWWDGLYQKKPLHGQTYPALLASTDHDPAVNDAHFTHDTIEPILYRILKISGAIFASAILGYQFFDFVA